MLMVIIIITMYILFFIISRELVVHPSEEGLEPNLISARVQDRIWLECSSSKVRKEHAIKLTSTPHIIIGGHWQIYIKKNAHFLSRFTEARFWMHIFIKIPQQANW